MYTSSGVSQVAVTDNGDLPATATQSMTVVGPIFRFTPPSLTLPIGATNTTTLYLDGLRSGLSGAEITLSLADPAVGEIIGVSLPGWRLTHKSTLPADTLWIRVVDVDGVVGTGDNALIGTVTVRGDRVGQSTFRIPQSSMANEEGDEIIAQPVACTVDVPFTLVILPSAKWPPQDPDINGKYDDVNANGRIDFADVVWLFNHL